MSGAASTYKGPLNNEHFCLEDAEYEYREYERRRKANGTTPGITLTPFDAITLASGYQPYLVKGVIPKEGLVVLWGPPKSGKSFWAFDICMHVALGWDYRGRKVHQGEVVYCSFEGQAGIATRIEAFRQERLPEEPEHVPFYAQTMTLDLVKQVDSLIAVIQDYNLSPAIVALDTLNRSLRGSENSDEDMGDYIKAADAIREAFNCAVIVVHHCGIEGSRPRGHTSLTGAADAQLACRRDQNNNVQVTVEWMKDGSSEGEVITSKLTPVEVGTDDDGEPVTSCVLEAAEPIRMEHRGKRLPANQDTMLTILREAGKDGLSLAEWNEKAKAQGIGVNRRASLYDAQQALKQAKLVHSYADRWYVT